MSGARYVREELAGRSVDIKWLLKVPQELATGSVSGCCWDGCLPGQSAWFQWASNSASCQGALQEVAAPGPLLLGRPMESSRLLLWPGPLPAAVGIWGVHQPMEDLCFCLYNKIKTEVLQKPQIQKATNITKCYPMSISDVIIYLKLR